MTEGKGGTMETKAPIEIDEESYDAQVREAKGAVLVDCWAPWCGPCRMTNPIIRALARDYGDTLTVAKLNSDENRYMSGALELTGLPSFLLYVDGEEVDRLVGGVTRDRFEEMLRRHKVI
jgi:thioredoxin